MNSSSGCAATSCEDIFFCKVILAKSAFLTVKKKRMHAAEAVKNKGM